MDAIINHMTGGGSGTGSDGSSYNGDSLSFPSVPFGSNDFNGPAECSTGNLEIQVSLQLIEFNSETILKKS